MERRSAHMEPLPPLELRKLAADGSLMGEVRDLDLAPLFSALRGQIDALNVEGACVMGDQLWIMHRGNRGSSGNVVAELSLERVMNSILGDAQIDPGELAALRSYELGDLDGIPLAFSDATPLGGDLLVFTASAEDPGADGRDGAIRGSVVGSIDLDGNVRRMRTIDRRWKVEGGRSPRQRRHGSHGFRLRVRPGRPGRALTTAFRCDAGGGRLRVKTSPSSGMELSEH